MRRLGLRDQRTDRVQLTCAAHIGHMKSKSTLVIEMASTKSRRSTLAELGHTSTRVMKMALIKLRRKAKASSLAEVGYTSTLVSHS